MREVAWEQNYPDRGRRAVGWRSCLLRYFEQSWMVDIWRTTYYHQMPSRSIDWVTATGLRPWLRI